MPSGEVHYAAAAKQPAHPSRGFPRFIQLLARETSRMAHGAADTIQECFTCEARKIPIRETVT